MIQTPSQRYINVPKLDKTELIWRFAIALVGMVACYASYVLFYDKVWLSFTSILVFMVQASAWGVLQGKMYYAHTRILTEDLPDFVEEQQDLYRKFGRAVIVMALIDLFPLYMMLLGGYRPWNDFGTLWWTIILGYLPNTVIMLANLMPCWFAARELFGWKKSKLETIYDNFLATGMTEEEEKEEEERKEYSRDCDHYGIGFRKIDDSFIYNDRTHNVFINGSRYSYAQVVGYTIEDNSYRRMSVTSKETTDPLNFLGRAAISDALYGKTGAMMGGMTANRNVESEVYEHVTPCHTIYITVDSMFMHTEQLRIFNDTQKVREIESVLRLITLRR